MSLQLRMFEQNEIEPSTKPADRIGPSSYVGLQGFHKYWGKKPPEAYSSMIEMLTKPNDVVFDPFFGSGVAAREAVALKRRFIGCDINPIAVRLAELLLNPPPKVALEVAFSELSSRVKHQINRTYSAASDEEASVTHLLWDADKIVEVWSKHKKKPKIVQPPEKADYILAQKYAGYVPEHIRTGTFWHNSRINSKQDMSTHDLFSARALHNVDILLAEIKSFPIPVRRALELTLTASSGQMSNMVFAISGRGKTTGETKKKWEVGSWVIGYWRPTVRFEINVWNCFERRYQKLIRALTTAPSSPEIEIAKDVSTVISGSSRVSLMNDDYRNIVKEIPAASIDLIVTDPPHGDRIPYLELSEMWNSLIGASANFDSELVVSNAKVRAKTKRQFAQEFSSSLDNFCRILKPEGFLVLMFNSRDDVMWKIMRDYFDKSCEAGGIRYLGSAACEYSALSVVQDNRDGAMKSDYFLFFGREPNAIVERGLTGLPNFSLGWPSVD